MQYATTKDKVDFQKAAQSKIGHLMINGLKDGRQSQYCNDRLKQIIEFANSVSGVIKQFAELCREHARKIKEMPPEIEEVRNQLIRERKKRMELEDIIRQKVSEPDQLPIGPHIERKRPKTAFTLFVTDQRDKILREHPTLDLYKITTLAAIKWKKLSRDQQLVYQKKLQEMNSVTEQQNASANTQQNNEGHCVKREHGQNNEDRQNQPRQQGEDRQEQNINYNHALATNNFESSLGGTMANEQTQKPFQENRPKEKHNIQQLLDLFHSQVQQVHLQHSPVLHQPNIQKIEQELKPPSLQPIHPPQPLDFTPSIQIVQAANQNNPIVIPPTIQE